MSQTTILPDPDETLRRLIAVNDNERLVQEVYPVFVGRNALQTVTETSVAGIALAFMVHVVTTMYAISDGEVGWSNPLYNDGLSYIEALVDNPVVKDGAKRLYRAALDQLRQ